MLDNSTFDRIAEALQDALELDMAVTRVMLQMIETGYAIGLSDAQKAS